jgi:hypothetical protein
VFSKSKIFKFLKRDWGTIPVAEILKRDWGTIPVAEIIIIIIIIIGGKT